MKQLLMVCTLGVFLASCTKEYTCECVYTETTNGNTYTTETSLTNTKKGAEDNCAYLSGTSYSGQEVYEKECSLK